ncbi:hypothetical protein DICPUDRAFT_31606 [Dictyostelium purpureum]|uniref:Regulator of microtubule dynamics protein 1 n=1 Tax=Dictyostelium purpureum TaxID=5786 RepID=F0ZHG4_DICPU|nr:uncharacterized protein DICPUDRAFT_31606 [Dictyostelium purpureum]EGC36611.1 hypothetical protein DICPUDRAFT_31606 [Dictyostelium purpureum]|eukprot:XP_003286849.1 hypothetical protein DICPUDRAFT_31606 [Dictyostelium purpureum]
MSEEIIANVDELHKNGEFAKVFETLTEADKNSPNNVEILWRLSRAYFDKNEETNDKAQKKQFVETSVEYANKAITADPNHWAAHKWVAISLSALGDHVSSKEKIANAFKIKEHAVKADELKPKDPTTLHLLGRWCFSIASIGFIERGIASALFGTPPTSTYDEALKYFLAAYEADPNLIRNAIFIGDSYTQLKNTPKAKEFYKIAASIEPKNEFEKTLVKEAQNKAK